MTDRKLDKLKDLSVPAPSDAARKLGLASALAAFDAHDNSSADTQGADDALRPTDATSNRQERQGMRYNRKIYWSMAASVAAVLLAMPVAINTLSSWRAPVELAKVETPPAPSAAQPASGGPASPSQPAPVGGNRDDGLGLDVDERVAELSATTARKGNRKVEMTIETPDGQRLAARGGELVPVAPAPPIAAAPATTANEMPGQSPNGYVTSNNNSRTRFRFVGDAKIKDEHLAEAYKSGRSGLGVTMSAECPPGRVCAVILPRAEANRDKFDATPPNPIKQTATEPVSTFSVDVDTASYALARRFLNQGRLPPKDAVRVEEMINYFKYDYRRPESAAAPFEPQVTITPSPWNTGNKLVHIALKGYELKAAERPRANIVLLVDISGSMMPADRLPLLKNAFRMMVDELKPDDTIGIVTYASGSDIRLAPTKVADKARIIAAIDSLGAGGSTAGAAGLTDAYRVAEENFDAKAVNRIILGTDGDWNVGITNQNELTAYIERKRQSGILLSILGVGMGNHNDALMQKLAQSGNGVAAYIDTLSEARKVLVDEVSSSLFTIAKDVKIQVEFNPVKVSEYRLIGYETRALRREDFNNDKVDAGDVGSGHSVTAIYEITPVGAAVTAMPELRYGPSPATAPAKPARIEATAKDAEYGFLKLRYKLPAEETSRLIELPITASLDNGALAAASDDVRFSVAVAAYGQLLRGSKHLGALTYDDVIALANGARGSDPFGLRGEFVNLARLAKSARP